VTTSSTSRTLHLVDLENLLGNPRADAPRALSMLDAYLDIASRTTHSRRVTETDGSSG